MKKNYTEIIFILDKSGSMNKMFSDVVGGVDSFIQSQKADKDDTRMTMVQFNNKAQAIYTSKPVAELSGFYSKDYHPSGGTALLDAIGNTIRDMKRYFESMNEDERPENVVLVIQTDGMENSSRTYNKDHITKMIKEQEEQGWKVIYLGANSDAFNDNNSIGLSGRMQMNYAGSSNTDAFNATSEAIKSIKNKTFSYEDSMNAYLENEKGRRNRGEGL